MKDLRRTLESNGLSVTGSRLKVLSKLREAKRPLSIGQIVALFSEGELDRVTAYRTLSAFLDRGIVHRIEGDNGTWHYEICKCPETEHALHSHFVCSECKKVMCLESTRVAFPYKEIRECNLSVEDVQVKFTGICGHCREKGKGSTSRSRR